MTLKTSVSEDTVGSLIRIPATGESEIEWPVKNRDETAESIYRLHRPYRNHATMTYSNYHQDFDYCKSVENALDERVYLRFLMWASPQQMEFRWPETSDECFASGPDIYAISGEDGVLLDEPKRLLEGRIVTIPKEYLTLGN